MVRGMVDEEILAYYGHGLEQNRLADGRQRIEFLRVWDLLERHLPPPPARILDVGGGAGVYAVPLAAAGYEVHLVDPVPLHVDQATAASREAAVRLAGVSVGDALDLEAADDSVEVVLLLGPLYHLTSKADRLAALREARRVVRPGGLVVAKALSRFYPVFETLTDGLGSEPGEFADTPRFLADGQYRNPSGDPARFTTSYFHRPEELAGEIQEADLDLRALVGASGPVKLFAGIAQRLEDSAQREHLLSVLRMLESEPSIIGMSQNFIAVAQCSCSISGQ
jgi:ubiquinone/menaquinone biosynthesis C-methylase UbiE